MPYTYPPAQPTITGDVLTINRFLQSPAALARRMRTLAEQRYIADAVLTGRYEARGGSILYETGETMFTPDNPRAVNPGAEYPLTVPVGGTAALASTVKWGQDVIVTDEAISRLGFDPVGRALNKLVNRNVQFVDSIALTAIGSAVTASTNATADWSIATAAQILGDVLQAKAQILALNQGYDPDTVVVDDVNYAFALGAFVAAGIMPREDNAANPALTGNFPVVAGMRWLPTPNVPLANVAFVIDTKQLGGMADENLGGGYTSAASGVEVKSIRDDEKDQWRLRARRVTVPVVVEPAAGRRISAI